jgi:hypothetical protein
LLSLGVPALSAQQPHVIQGQHSAPEEDVAKIPNKQLDSLVAPITLYPDPLLAQTLTASTSPLGVIQLQQWMANNSYLKDQALADAVENSHARKSSEERQFKHHSRPDSADADGRRRGTSYCY